MKRMKAKKALKRLRKVRESVATVVEEWDKMSSEVRELLTAADDGVSRALALVEANASSGSTKAAANRPQKHRVSARRRRNGRFTEEHRQKLSLAAKKRWAAAKRKGATSLAGQA